MRLKKGLQKYLKGNEQQKKSKVKEEAMIAKKTKSRTKKNTNNTSMHKWSDDLLTKWPYRPLPKYSILVIGDGDTTFSQSLLSKFDKSQIVCTVLDRNKDELSTRYPDAKIFPETIYNVDVCKKASLKLVKRQEHPIGCIVFNFPHTGEGIKDRTFNIRAQQKLLISFFDFASHLLPSPEQDQLLIKRSHINTTLSEGFFETETQFGCVEPEVHLTLWEGDPYTDWNVKKLGKASGFEYRESFLFNFDLYPGYGHRKTSHANDKQFAGRSARTFVFVKK